MLNSFTIGSYYATDSKIHTMHPLTKIVCSLLLILSIVNTSSLLFILFNILLIIGIVSVSKLPFKLFTKGFISSKYFLLSILFINVFFSNSLLLGIITVVKMLMIIVISEILLFTTKINSMINGLELFLRPLSILKISSTKIAFSLALAIHFIPLLLEQANKVIKTQASRGLIFSELSLKEKLKKCKTILFPIFNSAIRKADLIADSLQIRNLDFNKKRSNVNFYKLSIYDIITMLFFGIILLLSFI